MAPAAEMDMARGTPLPRIPKLAYRNPLPADQVSISSASTSTSEGPSNGAYAVQPTSSTPSSTEALSSATPSVGSKGLTSLSLASSNASVSTSTTGAKKKKGSAVRGFLTLKEPSQSAFEQFAEQQRKQQAEKGGKTTPNGQNNFSPQKLPATVPKVNSKWDGLPDAKRNRDSMISSSKRSSTQSTACSAATSRRSATPSISGNSCASDGSRDPPNTLSSAPSSNSSILLTSGTTILPVERRDSGPSVPRSEKYSSPSTTTLPEITYFFPDNPNENRTLSRPSHGGNDKHLSLTSSSLSDSSNASSSNSGATSNCSEAPNSRTTTMSSAKVPHDTNVDLRAVLRRASATSGFLAGEAHEVYFPDDGSSILTKEELESAEETEEERPAMTEQVIALTTPTASPLPSPLSSPSLGSGFPRFGPMNFSRPLSSQTISPIPEVSRLSVGTFVNGSGVTELPTLYEASTASSSNTTVYHLQDSRLDKDSDAVSLASSVAPSEMSASWYRTSRERLGLGGRIRKSDVLPWEPSEESVPGKKKKGALSMFAR